ncbi:MAG TPA: SRPBCC family protein [Rhizomicrobium sp.]|nr:SRPBCC family protein [Rhizomicrobium sp.]
MSTKFVYVTYIRATPAKVWDALTKPEFQRQYWYGMHQESEWTKGSAWAMKFTDGRVADAGEILESEPPNRLVIKWRNEFRDELKAEGFSRCVYELAEDQGVVRLTITHSIERDNAKIIDAVSGGWPRILASLKSYLENGTPLPRTHQPPQT